MKPALLAEWDLAHVLAQLHHVKHSASTTADSQHKGVFKENPDPADLSQYHIGISDHPPPTHLEFQCGELFVSNEGTGLRAQRLPEVQFAGSKDAHKMQLPEQWWVSSEVAAAAIKKVARQEQEDSLKKSRAKQEQAAGFSSSAPAVKKQPTLAAGTMTLGNRFLPQCFVWPLPFVVVAQLCAWQSHVNALAAGLVVDQAALLKTPSSSINVLQIQRVMFP
jgi:hypothetical protein